MTSLFQDVDMECLLAQWRTQGYWSTDDRRYITSDTTVAKPYQAQTACNTAQGIWSLVQAINFGYSSDFYHIVHEWLQWFDTIYRVFKKHPWEQKTLGQTD